MLRPIGPAVIELPAAIATFARRSSANHSPQNETNILKLSLEALKLEA